MSSSSATSSSRTWLYRVGQVTFGAYCRCLRRPPLCRALVAEPIDAVDASNRVMSCSASGAVDIAELLGRGSPEVIS